MHVHVEQARKHGHSFGADDFDAGGHRDVTARTQRDDSLARNQHHTVLYDGSAESVEDPAANES